MVSRLSLEFITLITANVLNTMEPGDFRRLFRTVIRSGVRRFEMWENVSNVMSKKAAIVKPKSIAKTAPKATGKAVKGSVKPSVLAKKQTVLVRTVKKMKDVKVKKIATPKTSLKSVTKAKKPLDKSNKATVNEKKQTVNKVGTAKKILKVSRNPIKKVRKPVKKSIKSEAVGKKKISKLVEKSIAAVSPKKNELLPTKLEKEAIAKAKDFLVERLSHMGPMTAFDCPADARFRIQKWYLGSAYKYRPMTKVDRRAFYGGFLMTFPANVPTFLVPVGLTETDIILSKLKNDPKEGFMKTTEKLSFEEAISRERFIYLPVPETNSPILASLSRK
ncbi:hypothetical protein PRIPAC_73068 [Pristionchus pacificus]|uniref:Uncharacterized protein n=1 Tax=Pristionchus pacificus TaxID=54126 RepID=A0A2A6C1U2_PRIPA|nr:hypothetical protein PRIPAC_73068 [Pristionchus pacificus]|eukprot:PDM72001.1 hypothetical protein PRIPAC_38408 [Pristionchus pacificus]